MRAAINECRRLELGALRSQSTGALDGNIASFHVLLSAQLCAIMRQIAALIASMISAGSLFEMSAEAALP